MRPTGLATIGRTERTPELQATGVRSPRSSDIRNPVESSAGMTPN